MSFVKTMILIYVHGQDQEISLLGSMPVSAKRKASMPLVMKPFILLIMSTGIGCYQRDNRFIKRASHNPLFHVKRIILIPIVSILMGNNG
jgi:hypothetical protein